MSFDARGHGGSCQKDLQHRLVAGRSRMLRARPTGGTRRRTRSGCVLPPSGRIAGISVEAVLHLLRRAQRFAPRAHLLASRPWARH